jgi:hypothetical protein
MSARGGARGARAAHHGLACIRIRFKAAVAFA